MTERDIWVQREKEALVEIMLEHGIEWAQKGEHRDLSVLEYEMEQRAQGLADAGRLWKKSSSRSFL